MNQETFNNLISDLVTFHLERSDLGEARKLFFEKYEFSLSSNFITSTFGDGTYGTKDVFLWEYLKEISEIYNLEVFINDDNLNRLGREAQRLYLVYRRSVEQGAEKSTEATPREGFTGMTNR